MEPDKDFWKKQYKDLWKAGTEKEVLIKNIIEEETGLKVEFTGLGAGTDDYLSGDAEEHNLTKGDADLHIQELECYIEVTGPNIPMSISAPIWIRPDKLENTQKKIRKNIGKLHIIVHVMKEATKDRPVIRVIELNDKFFKDYKKLSKFTTVYPTIRGQREKYVEIPSDYPGISALNDFIKKLKK